MESTRIWIVVLAVAAGLTTTACDGGKDTERKELEAFANTALTAGTDPETEAARKADEARRKKAFEEKKAAEEAEKARWDGVVADVVKLPEKMPRKLEAACDAMLDGYHEFMLKQFEGDDKELLEWYDRKRVELGERRGKCMKLGSLEAAACQANALSSAPGGLRGKHLELMSACAEKFAPEQLKAVAAEQRKEELKAQGADADQAG